MSDNAIALRPEGSPKVFARDGQVFADSRDVAEFFHKQHAHVMRDIRKLIDQGVSNFGEGSYTLPETGSQQHPCFTMTRDGFSILAMGFTGKQALKWKLLFLEAFNRMERELRDRPATLDLLDPEALRALLLDYAEKALAVKARTRSWRRKRRRSTASPRLATPAASATPRSTCRSSRSTSPTGCSIAAGFTAVSMAAAWSRTRTKSTPA